MAAAAAIARIVHAECAYSTEYEYLGFLHWQDWAGWARGFKNDGLFTLVLDRVGFVGVGFRERRTNHALM